MCLMIIIKILGIEVVGIFNVALYWKMRISKSFNKLSEHHQWPWKPISLLVTYHKMLVRDLRAVITVKKMFCNFRCLTSISHLPRELQRGGHLKKDETKAPKITALVMNYSSANHDMALIVLIVIADDFVTPSLIYLINE